MSEFAAPDELNILEGALERANLFFGTHEQAYENEQKGGPSGDCKADAPGPGNASGITDSDGGTPAAGHDAIVLRGTWHLFLRGCPGPPIEPLMGERVMEPP